MARTVTFLGQERTTVDEGYAGDILGVWDGGSLRIGDTLAERASFEFEGVPRFSPEHFVQVTLKDPLKRKQLKKGLQQLSEEGAVQLFFDRHRLERDPILGAVGHLGDILDEDGLAVVDAGNHITNVRGSAQELAGFQQKLPVAAGEFARPHPPVGKAQCPHHL